MESPSSKSESDNNDKRYGCAGYFSDVIVRGFYKLLYKLLISAISVGILVGAVRFPTRCTEQP